MKSYVAQKSYESSKKTRVSIQRLFLKLAETVPFYKVSVSEICKKMGITRTAFYYHFDDLYAVLDSILDEVIEASGMADVFLAWAERMDVSLDTACKVAIDCIGRYAFVNQYQALLTNAMLSGYAIDYIISREKDVVVSAMMRENPMGRAQAEQQFRFSFAGMFFLGRNQCWDHFSTTVYYRTDANQSGYDSSPSGTLTPPL